MIFDAFANAFSCDVAMDLGTANTLVHMKGRGITLNEPSMVVLSKKTGQILAIGSQAKAMYGKTPKEFEVIRPMKDGVISDFDATKKMISYFIKQSGQSFFRRKPKIIIGVPSGITQVEKKAVIDSAI